MIKELVGVVTTFFVMLPFLWINIIIFKINDRKKFVFLFLFINIIQGAFLFLLAYGLFVFGQESLKGMLIVFMVYLFLFLILLFTYRRRITRIKEGEESEENEEDEEEDGLAEEELADVFYDEELFETQKMEKTDSVSNENILEEDQYTRSVEEPDFSKIEKEEVLKTLDDIFKEI